MNAKLTETSITIDKDAVSIKVTEISDGLKLEIQSISGYQLYVARETHTLFLTDIVSPTPSPKLDHDLLVSGDKS